MFNYLNLRIAEKLLSSDVASLQSPYKYLKVLGRHLDSEASTRGVLYKKEFLKISQNSQENICARASFLIRVQVSGLQLY